MLIVIPAIFLERGVFEIISRSVFLNEKIIFFLNIFIGVALVEEFLKYFVVKWKVLNSPELDEPVDIMLYMIIAALGFAAFENILILCPLGPSLLIAETLKISGLRFIGATFLHALASGMLGYFLALSFCYSKKRKMFLFLGFLLTIGLHGLYNFSIMELEGKLVFLIPVLILIGLTIFVTFGFRRLKKLKSICKIR